MRGVTPERTDGEVDYSIAVDPVDVVTSRRCKAAFCCVTSSILATDRDLLNSMCLFLRRRSNLVDHEVASHLGYSVSDC